MCHMARRRLPIVSELPLWDLLSTEWNCGRFVGFLLPIPIPSLVLVSHPRGECIYVGRLQSSWTHLITLSRNFVEVRWRSLFRSNSLGKRCTSYNALAISRKRATDRWSLGNFCFGAPFSWLEKPRNRMGRDLDCMPKVLTGFHHSVFSNSSTEFNSDLAHG
jgi:hypothetical protein